MNLSEELQGHANEAIQELEARNVELVQERDGSSSNDHIIVEARYQAFEQAQNYVDEQIHIWKQFVGTHVAIHTELGTINQRIEGFFSMVNATAAVCRDALNLLSFQQDIRWALSLFYRWRPSNVRAHSGYGNKLGHYRLTC